MKPAIQLADRNELPHAMEPLRLSDSAVRKAGIMDLALDLSRRASGFRRSLPEGMGETLATLVRAMNCYYSNLIEGHDTHPIDIERALRNDYSRDSRKRDLQLEAKAHIAVQGWIDTGGLAGRAALTSAGIQEIHRRFRENLPEELLLVSDRGSKERVRVGPGEFRQRDVIVGQHVPVSAGAVPRFLEHFESVYGEMSPSDLLVHAAAVHHRFTWIHPFLDGNGRVAPLMSHALLLELLDTGALWSLSRGLYARASEYKAHLSACDRVQAESALAAFTRFFLTTCIDQVSFMEQLMRPDQLRFRILPWAETEIRTGQLPARSTAILEALLYRGELGRGEAAAITGTSDRQARRTVSSLLEKGVLVSASHLAPLRLAFPATLASHWMPGLFPPAPSS